ncbi:MAG: hypothetical protein O7G88_02785 [bacterium]|nr:hypothetical protein [bacterium]
MRNIVGQTPRGDDFFPRDTIANRIYRRLSAGENVYLAAPRRVGKTAIMRHLEDKPRENYEFKYIITESVDNATDYFKRLLESLHRLKSLPRKSLDAIGGFLRKIKGVKIGLEGVGFELDNAEKSEYFAELKGLMEKLDTGGTKVVIMIDEFPQTVKNILEKNDAEAAKQFLQLNREIRHLRNENVGFILTGSIGLPMVAEQLDATVHINDLSVIEVPPLNRQEARAFTTRLLNYENVRHAHDAIDYLLDKIEWFVPFHIQLVVQELIDEHLDTGEPVNNATVDNAFDKIADRRNDIYFAHYYSRLKGTFPDGRQHAFALALLEELAQENARSAQQIDAIAAAHHLENYGLVLRTLEFDGYIFRHDDGNKTFYRFTSPVLRLWWRTYVKR